MPYATIDTICQQLDPPLSAAEVHGMAAAMLCSDEKLPGINWLSQVQGDTLSITDEDKELLLLIFEQTREILISEDFTFDLFLPDENNPLPEQAVALKEWCQGFVYAIGLSYDDKKLPDESKEIVKDIIEFSKLNADIGNDEEDENALVEIIEYLRVTIRLVKEDLYLTEQ